MNKEDMLSVLDVMKSVSSYPKDGSKLIDIFIDMLNKEDDPKPRLNDIKFYEREESFDFARLFNCEGIKNLKVEDGIVKAIYWSGDVTTITRVEEMKWLLDHFDLSE